MEHMVQILMPLQDHQGQPFPQAVLDEMRRDLMAHFSGVNMHLRAPAPSVWAAPEGHDRHADVVIFEVMCERLDRCWWHDYRRHLESRFRQQEIIVRAVPVEKL